MINKSKVCFKCKIEKECKHFYFEKKSSDKMSHYCKECVKKNNNDKRKTKKGLILSIFNKQTFHSKNRGHGKQKYTKLEFFKWIENQNNFKILYEQWVESNYEINKRPSVDRINDLIGYSIDNIQLMTWLENKKKQNEDLKNGIGSTGCSICKKINQFTKDNVFLKSYNSISIASRETKTNRTSIVSCLKNKYKTANNFIWKYCCEEK